MSRRRPVPAEVRDDHNLRVTSRATGNKWQRYSRSKGRCSCGARFPFEKHNNSYTATAVRDAWKDHVERVYYGEADERDRVPEWQL